MNGWGGGVGYNYDHDKFGNVTDNGRVEIGYSGTYELPTSMSGGVDASYAYDGNNRRAYQNIDGEETFTFYSQSGAILLPATLKLRKLIRLSPLSRR